jgi:Flp pilus assembly protein TadG
MKRRAGERGNAFIELAVAVSVLVPLSLGTFQFGYSYYMYNKVCNAVRAGARYASLRTYEPGRHSDFVAAVRNVVLYGNPAGGSTPVAASLAPGNVAVDVQMASGIPRTVRVAIVNYQLNAIVAQVNFNNKPSAMFPYTGRYSP